MTASIIAYLFDTPESHENLLPLSFTRPIPDIRIGIDTIREKWQRLSTFSIRYLPVGYLREKFGPTPDPECNALFIPGDMVPDRSIVAELSMLQSGEALINNDNKLIGFRGKYDDLLQNKWIVKHTDFSPLTLRYTFDIFLNNPQQIDIDFREITSGRSSQSPDSSNTIIGPLCNSDGSSRLFIEPGASVIASIINLTDGPIYIGKNAKIMEGSMIRGPLALCQHTIVRMGSKIYGGSTFGPWCKVGGEIDNSVIFGFSNKAHDGYLGNAVIGEWCNIGAGVNASNLKNDYSKIRIWNYHSHTFMRTDLQFCGPIIGDHTKVGVNCMLNTATVLGVGVNIHGAGFPRVFVPSFSEGSPTAGFTSVPVKKFITIAERAISRRDLSVKDSDIRIFEKVYDVASRFKK